MPKSARRKTPALSNIKTESEALPADRVGALLRTLIAGRHEFIQRGEFDFWPVERDTPLKDLAAAERKQLRWEQRMIRDFVQTEVDELVAMIELKVEYVNMVTPSMPGEETRQKLLKVARMLDMAAGDIQNQTWCLSQI